MRASLDTNVIVHFYRAGLQHLLFDLFDDVFVYEQIRDVELKNHGEDVLDLIDVDIESGKILKYTDQKLKELAVFRIFEEKVKENKNLYGAGDLGEVYAISLAQTLGAYALVTDDIKQGGPYMSLLQFEDEIMPFTFADVLLLRYLFGMENAEKTIKNFEAINKDSNLNWSFKSQIAKFIRRFWREPYREEDKKWIQEETGKREVNIKGKFTELRKWL
ncbi:MAG: PIN domain-containing protein [Lachnospiraceae bacterium]|nr:PIN domain-containing protein [Lachnospiraceae bacterium]